MQYKTKGRPNGRPFFHLCEYDVWQIIENGRLLICLPPESSRNILPFLPMAAVEPLVRGPLLQTALFGDVGPQFHEIEQHGVGWHLVATGVPAS